MRSETVRVVTLDQADLWREIHEKSGVPSHDWKFNQELRLSGVNAKLGFVQVESSQLTLVFQEREWHGHVDVATTLSISGATMTSPDQRLLDCWRDHAVSQGWVAGYLQLGPGVPTHGLRDCVPGNGVIILDIGSDSWLANLSRSIADKRMQAKTTGVRLIADRDAVAEAMVALYPATMERRGAAAYNWLAPQTIAGWAKSTSCVALGAGFGNAIEAVVLFPFFRDQSEFRISATTPAGRSLTAWLICEAIEHLRVRGVRTLNLGGGVRAGDGLYAFKARFGGTPMQLHAVRQVYRPDLYVALCKDAQVGPEETWFPAYRAARANPQSSA